MLASYHLAITIEFNEWLRKKKMMSDFIFFFEGRTIDSLTFFFFLETRGMFRVFRKTAVVKVEMTRTVVYSRNGKLLFDVDVGSYHVLERLLQIKDVDISDRTILYKEALLGLIYNPRSSMFPFQFEYTTKNGRHEYVARSLDDIEAATREVFRDMMTRLKKYRVRFEGEASIKLLFPLYS